MINELIGQTLAGKYRIEEPLRRDAFGVTYRAAHVLMDKPVAVKVLNPALAADAGIVLEFQEEAKMLSRLSHPHVLNVTDYGADDSRGVVFLVMENFDGRSLKDLIAEEKQIALARAVNILEQTASALDAAHSAGIVHGGLRSDSILLASNAGKDWVKVVDFDAANKRFETNRLDANDSDDENAVFYFSPEQATGIGAADARSDVYALGVILYEALTGRLPFMGASADEVRRKHAEEIPPSLLALRPELPPALEQVVQRALAKQPAQRFQIAADFTEALVNAADNAPVSSWREQIPIVPAQTNAAALGASQYADGRWRTAFIVLAGISLLSAGLFFFTQSRRTDPSTMGANMMPVQPVNPATGLAEQQQQQDLSNMQFPPVTNGDGNPVVIPPGGGGGGGAVEIPYGGRIPPGLYPPGQVYQVDPNSPFTNDNYNGSITANRPANASPSPNPANKNANASAANSKPANTNPANAGGAANTAPTPATPATPTPKPAASPKAAQEKPASKQTPKPADKAPGESGGE